MFGLILLVGLSAFWIYKFIFISYEPSVFFLLGIIWGGLIACCRLEHPTQAIRRFFVRFKVDSKGITCNGLGFKPWYLKWEDICIYGIEGYGFSYGMGIIFLSSDANERFDKNKFTLLSKQRIVFEACDEIWTMLRNYMPSKMRNDLEKAICEKRNCFYRKCKDSRSKNDT